MSKRKALHHCFVPNDQDDSVTIWKSFSLGGIKVLKDYMSGRMGHWDQDGEWFLINDVPSYHFNERIIETGHESD